MNAHAKVEIGHSVCPHDCPSTCALDVELLGDDKIGRVHGAKDNSYTAGVICAKVARYAERIHHPDRLLHPLRRKGPKGSGQFERISWDDALDITAEAMLAAERSYGPEAVWPYYYAGTMGLVMRDGINRLRHAKRYSGMYATICTTLAWTGFIAGTGKLAGPDPREMAKSDLVVIWGTNPVNTQVNVMTHAIARPQGARRQDRRHRHLPATAPCSRPTWRCACGPAPTARSPARSCTCCSATATPTGRTWSNTPTARASSKRTCKTRTPEWASAITGLSVAEIETFAKMVGTTPRTYFRLGYGFARQRNGAHNMHAALCIPSVTGAWLHEGGGGFHNNGAIYHWNKSLIEGLDVADPSVRVLDQSRIGPVLTGDPADLKGGPPVTALFIQNINPVQVAPEQRKVKAGFAREDLFTCVHEQFMTATAQMADVVLPATMFLEHDDVYQGGGHQHILLGPEADRAAGRMPLQPRGDLRAGQARRRRAPRLRHEPARDHRLDPAEVRLGHARRAGSQEVDRLPAGVRRRRTTSTASRYPDKKFRFKPDWPNVPAPRANGIAHRPRHAGPARPLGRDREGGRAAPVPARHQPVARLPQLVLQRDADQPRQARASRASRCIPTTWRARHRRWRARAHGQRARRDHAARPRPSRACSAASSSSRASRPTTSSRAAKASTR